MIDHLESVRPLLFTTFVADPQAAAAMGSGDDERESSDLDVVRDLSGHADLSDPIVGYDVTFSDDKGPGALAIRPLPSPQEPSPSEMARHFISHLPYAPWCPFCVAFRRPNNHHRRCHDSARLIPLLVG